MFITDLARYLISCLTSLSCNTLILIYQNLSHRIFRLVCPNRKQTLTRSVEQSLSLSQQNRVPLNVRRLLAPETYLIDPRELQNWVTVEVANWGAEIGQTLVLWKAPPPPHLTEEDVCKITWVGIAAQNVLLLRYMVMWSLCFLCVADDKITFHRILPGRKA